MDLVRNQKIIIGSVATLATLVIVVKIANQNIETAFQPETKPHILTSIDDKLEKGSNDSIGPVAAQQLPVAPTTNVAPSAAGKTLNAPIPPKLSAPTRSNMVMRESAKVRVDDLKAKKLGRSRNSLELSDGGIAGGGELEVDEDVALIDNLSGRSAVAVGKQEFGDIRPDRQVWNIPPSYNQNREAYRAYAENERIRVATEPLSTFSIDVDTGSYTNVRRFLASGQLPPADAVRIEEFVNYFDYNYPSQTEKPFAVYSEIAPSPLDKEHYLLKLGVKTRDIKQSDAAWNLVFLVDVSGSMQPENRLPLVQRSLHLLADKMRAQDHVSIVTYAGDSRVALESTVGSDKAKIHSAIDSLSSGGSTNGSGGISMAYQMAEKNKVAGGVNRIILATDGDFNVGVTSFDDLVRMVEQKRESGITLTTIGVGEGNYQEATMEQLADKGNGNYFYLDGFKEARKVFETDLTANMEVVAKDVKLQVEFNPGQVKEYRLIGYDNRKLRKEDFANDRIDAGEIGAGHIVTALYEFVPAKGQLAEKLDTELRYQKESPKEEKKVEVPANVTSELAFVKIRFKEPEGSTSKLLEFPIDSTHIKSDAKDTSDDFRFAAAVSYFGALLRHSQFVGSYTFADVVTLAQAARGEDKQGLRQEFIEMVKNAAAVSRVPVVAQSTSAIAD